METQLKKIDEAANNYNKTKDPQYKDLWYKLIREWNNGTNNFKRRTLSINSCHKANDGTYVFIGTSQLHGDVRNTTTKVDGVRRFYKFTHNE
jgi:hypothetical protein